MWHQKDVIIGQAFFNRDNRHAAVGPLSLICPDSGLPFASPGVMDGRIHGRAPASRLKCLVYCIKRSRYRHGGGGKAGRPRPACRELNEEIVNKHQKNPDFRSEIEIDGMAFKDERRLQISLIAGKFTVSP